MIKLQTEPIEVGELYESLKDPKMGGIVVFSGCIREWTGFDHTEFIEYTAYQEMAEKELAKLAEPFEKEGLKVVLVHRIGRLDIMDEALFCGVAAPHRYEAFKACHAIVDELKKRVPIWKKEVDGEVERWGK